MNAALFALLFRLGPVEVPEVIPGPWRATAGEIYVPGAKAGMTYVPGAEVGQVK